MVAGSPIDKHPRFRRLSDYLAAKAPAGKLPGRQHLEPMEIADLLPYVMLMDVIADPSAEPCYHIRLMGTEVVEIVGSDGTGKFVEEVLTGAEGPEIIRDFAEILRTKQPQYRCGAMAAIGREHFHYDRVAFPLAHDGENVDMLIFVFGSIGSAANPNPVT